MGAVIDRHRVISLIPLALPGFTVSGVGFSLGVAGLSRPGRVKKVSGSAGSRKYSVPAGRAAIQTSYLA
jgi:hypothetical protein